MSDFSNSYKKVPTNKIRLSKLFVCEKCLVFCNINDIKPRLICPVCGNIDPHLTITGSNLSREELEKNLRFYEFMKGKQNGTPKRRETSSSFAS